MEEDDDDDDEEDYDDLTVDPDTLTTTTKTMAEPVGTALDGADSDLPPSRPQKRNSIQIKLSKTSNPGHYTLTADDPEIREILRRGMEREQASASNKKPRTRFRDLVFTRQFTTFDRQNPASSESPFFGFFTLFWIAMVLLFFQVSMRNWREHGSILGRNQIMKMMFSRDVFVLAIADGVMYAACFEGYLMQLLVWKGYINWNKSGWIVQNVWQSGYLGAVMLTAYSREWPWTHTIFAMLHGLVFVMKQHSYAFYNGYLSGVYRRRALLERKLEELQTLEMQSPPTSPAAAASSSLDLPSVLPSNPAYTTTSTTTTNKRRPSMTQRTSTNLSTEHSDVATVALAMSSNQPIQPPHLSAFTRVIRAELADLNHELRGKNTSGTNAYPSNLRLLNLAEFICLPTLVYELEYPRQPHINWLYVLEKTTATFGVLGVMMVISQAFIYPPVARCVAMKAEGMSVSDRWREFPFIVSDMLFPLLIEQLLTWYLIWECILNVLAELTFFADRGFYGAWWNSVTWDQYARDWNRPVHNFLLRHVYHSSISTLKVGRGTATFLTFLLSALVHEMCMAVMFKKVRGYLFAMQLAQMPLVMVSRSKLLRGRTVLGNVIFWLG